jgi:putative ABC transport system permease protein
VEGWINYLLAALAIAYAAIAAVNTLVASVLGRRREFAVQRLAGATRAQVTRMLLVESGIVAVASLVLGTLIAGISVVSMAFAVGSLVPSGPIWVFLAVVGATFLIVWPATAIAARHAMKHQPIH